MKTTDLLIISVSLLILSLAMYVVDAIFELKQIKVELHNIALNTKQIADELHYDLNH